MYVQTEPSLGSLGSTLDVAKAVRNNQIYMKSLGWQKYYQQLAQLLGFHNMTPNLETFSEAMASWQSQRGLTPDGIVGPTTWKRLQKVLGMSPKTTSPSGKTTQQQKSTLLWLQTILKVVEGQTKVSTHGKNDAATRQALRHFQTKYGLGVNGQLTAATKYALIQTALEWIFFNTPIPNQPGIKGMKLVNKIIEFQQFYGLDDDGKVGPETRGTMVKVLNQALMRPFLAWTSPPVAPPPAKKIIWEPAPDPESVVEYGAQLQQKQWSLLPGKPRPLLYKGQFSPFEVRQGWLNNCPVAAILVAMAHVDRYRKRQYRRLPKMVRERVIRPRLFRTRRWVTFPIEKQKKAKIPASFTSDRLYDVFFYGQKTPRVVTPTLFWNHDRDLLNYAWSSKDALWPSIIEKAYIGELHQSRNYEKITPLFAEALTKSRTSLAKSQYSYDRLQHVDLDGNSLLSGLMVMIDMVGGGHEFLMQKSSNGRLHQLFRKHRKLATIVGVNDGAKVLTPDHYMAVVGYNARRKTVTLIDAQGDGDDLKDNDIRTVSFKVLRREVGEIIQERKPVRK